MARGGGGGERGQGRRGEEGREGRRGGAGRGPGRGPGRAAEARKGPGGRARGGRLPPGGRELPQPRRGSREAGPRAPLAPLPTPLSGPPPARGDPAPPYPPAPRPKPLLPLPPPPLRPCSRRVPGLPGPARPPSHSPPDDELGPLRQSLPSAPPFPEEPLLSAGLEGCTCASTWAPAAPRAAATDSPEETAGGVAGSGDRGQPGSVATTTAKNGGLPAYETRAEKTPKYRC
ncbi:cleavage and polyadenylation specificity factor subunit 6-like isoform X2 [Leopardus geoffroyi]|uniref:cleavage and polyadenylation specificity factor subunit 6-like isoform X2 n=1 Tax=Leopardus geoffroyi TaxID=46844 RepID=UPI001E26052B|nr:cleavage and polyadenylation specificity factor subunit 6-like isoform X2 [Leopardus geoffroyi]